MSEASILASVRIALSRAGARVFRNNVGKTWIGISQRFVKPDTVRVFPGDVLIRKARPFHAGLIAGSGDLIGWKSVLIVPEMVGTRVAIFTSCETKSVKGREHDAQTVWRDAVLEAGGIAMLVRSPEEAVAGLVKFR